MTRARNSQRRVDLNINFIIFLLDFQTIKKKKKTVIIADNNLFEIMYGFLNYEFMQSSNSK